MTNVTHTQLQSLIENDGLTVGETYVITDYSGYSLSSKAISTSELDDEWYDYGSRSDLVFHYVPSTNEVDYMKDTVYLIEGNFDWTSNITGKCYDVHLGDCNELVVSSSSNIFCEGISTGTITNCENIVLRGGNTVNLNGSVYLTINEGNNLTTYGSGAINVGSGNNITLYKLDCCHIQDRNTDLQLQGRNIIGSDNNDIFINGYSNIVVNGNKTVELIGDCNQIDTTKYTGVNGSYNRTKDTTLSTIDISYGNKLMGDEIEIKATNNNEVLTDSITIYDKPAFIQYQTKGSVKKVNNLVENINLQSDSVASVLMVDQQKFWNTDETKSEKHYIIVDGEWTNVNE